MFVTRALGQPALAQLDRHHEVVTWPGDEPPDPETLAGACAEAEGVLCTLSDRIDAELLARCPSLRVISNYAVGLDNIDLGAAAARGIAVGHTPEVLTDATADVAFGLLIAAARRMSEGEREVRAARWGSWKPGWLLGSDVSGSVLGIVGYGKIGRAMARRAHGFDMQVLWNASSGGTPLDELLRRADHVSLHCPLTAATRHLIDADALSAMKATATLVNTARGPVVDTEALYDALAGGTIAAAGLDVTDPEPLPPDHPLLSLANVVVTPHLASASVRSRARMAELAVANLLAGLAGRRLPRPALRSDG